MNKGENMHIEKYIPSNQTVLAVGRSDTAFGVVNFFMWGVIWLMVIGLGIWGIGVADMWNILAGWYFGILGVFFVWLIYRFARFKTTRYVMTNLGVYKITGILFKRVQYVRYDKIFRIKIIRGLIDIMCETGAVGVFIKNPETTKVKAGVACPELIITGVHEYQQVYNFIISKLK